MIDSVVPRACDIKADADSSGFPPVVPLDPGHNAPCVQWPENPGPATSAAPAETETTETAPNYSGSQLYAPREPGLYLLRTGIKQAIHKPADIDVLEGDWTDGNGSFWFANGAFEKDSGESDGDIIAPWPGNNHRLLTINEPWIAGDAFYDEANGDWIDCRTPFTTPSDRRLIRRKLWTNDDIVSATVEAPVVEHESATYGRADNYRNGVKWLLKSKGASKFFDACLLRGMDRLLDECPEELPLVADINYLSDRNSKEIQSATTKVSSTLERIAAAALILTVRRQDVLNDIAPANYSELIADGVTWAYDYSDNEAAQ